MYYTTIPTTPDKPNANRRWDAARLRELRKRLDAGGVPPQEMEDIARDMMEGGEIVELASDWLGNTVNGFISPFSGTILMILYRLYKSFLKNVPLLQE